MTLLALLACSDQNLKPIQDSDVPGVVVDTEDTEALDTEPLDTEDTEDDPCEDAPEHESSCDGTDEDCDGTVDEGADLEGCTQYWPDLDGDQTGDGEPVCTCAQPDGYAAVNGDCDDNEGSRIHCESCLQILQWDPTSADGTYTINPASEGTLAVLCDMTTDGGGWTMGLSMNPSSMTQYDGAEVLETKATVGALGDDNHLSGAFYRVAFSSAYLVDTTHGTPVVSAGAWTGTTIGAEVDQMLAGTPSTRSVWSVAPRSAFILRDSETTDSVFKNGDLRVHFMVNHDGAPDIAFPVTIDYLPDERHLLFDSDFGFAGGRVYTDAPYNIADYGVDETYRLYLR